MSTATTFIMYNDLCIEIDVLKEQIRFTEDELEYWFGIKLHDRYLNGIPFGSYGVHRFGVNTALAQAEHTINNLNKLYERLERIERAKNRIETLLGKFEHLEYKIAYMRFVEGKTLKEIAGGLGYSYQYIREVMSRIKREMEPTTNQQTY